MIADGLTGRVGVRIGLFGRIVLQVEERLPVSYACGRIAPPRKGELDERPRKVIWRDARQSDLAGVRPLQAAIAAAKPGPIPERYVPAYWRDMTPIDPASGSFGVGFVTPTGHVFLRLSVQDGGHVADQFALYRAALAKTRSVSEPSSNTSDFIKDKAAPTDLSRTEIADLILSAHVSSSHADLAKLVRQLQSLLRAARGASPPHRTTIQQLRRIAVWLRARVPGGSGAGAAQ